MSPILGHSSAAVKGFFYILILLCVSYANAHAQAEFVQNKGQWPDHVNFKASLPSGAMWAEDHGFTFNFYDPKVLQYLHPTSGVLSGEPIFKSHCYKLNFIGSNVPVTSGDKPKQVYYNYFKGQDPSHWAEHCAAFSRCDYEALYDGIDLVLYSNAYSVKYDFIVRAGFSPDPIHMEIEGAEVKLKKGELGNNLVVITSVNEVVEKAPYAYQIINGIMHEVPCSFSLNGNSLTFDLEEYDPEYDLVIDPEIAFSTYIGSPASNFGFTACDDTQGNLISGAAVFADNYPTTVGAYSVNFNSSVENYMDVAISKFDNTGSQLIYSTYIGGSGQETPHSIVADSNDNFIVMGVTGSDDYPTTNGSFQSNFVGGPYLSMSDFFTSFHANGTDIFVSKFSSAGALTASTFVGGAANDGLNYAGQLFYNYGDAFRGEVNVDAADHIFVSSVTRSNDFPMAGNSTQSTFGGGGSDGVVFKLNPTLTTMEWSSYFGGSNDDACYAIEFKSDGTLIVAGGTKSADFPLVTGSAYQPNYNGVADGFITLINSNSFNLNAGTFYGTSDYDQVYFVQTDDNDNVYAYGQTAGSMPITAGAYGQANSGQFITKFTPDLNALTWNTTIGTGSGEIDISPTAFLVSDCEQIYFSGWGGHVNSQFCAFHPCEATFSTTNGLPITADAYQASTDGSDFYLCVLNPNATGLLYASFLGGNESAEHVDGGTSRFDKNGSVYQAVCAGCQNNDDFPTTPGVWSSTNESLGCNIAVFRFDLNAVQAHVAIDGPDQVCVDVPVTFINTSVGASSYLWIFGDGDTSTEFEPSHAFTDGGTYTIQLIGMDDALCVNSDTAEVTITILPGVNPTIDPGGLICQGETYQLTSTGSANLHWLGSATLSATNIPNPIASPLITTTYTLVDENTCDAETLTVVIQVSIPQTTISDDVSICIGETTQLIAGGGATYAWSPATGLNNATVSNPICSATVTTDYTVTITTSDNCVVDEQVHVNVFNTSPGGQQYDDVTICEGSFVQLNASDGTSWLWTPGSSLNSNVVQNPYASPTDTTQYAVAITNACGQGTDFVNVNVIHPHVVADGGGTICSGSSVPAFAFGADSYLWQPQIYAEPQNQDTTMLTPPESMWITVTGVDEYHCIGKDSVFVYVFPSAQVDAGPDQYFEYPGSAYLIGNAYNFDFYWWPAQGLSCTDCLFPIASPEEETWYHLSVSDHNGCITDDSVFVKPYFPVWVPNCITPNNDGINDVFRAKGINITGFHLMIFDRWGLKVFESYDINEAWTGGLKGEYYVQNDVYNWVIEYDSIDRREKIAGHVTVAR